MFQLFTFVTNFYFRLKILQVREDPSGEAEVFYDVYENGNKLFLPVEQYIILGGGLQNGTIVANYTIHRRAEGL